MSSFNLVKFSLAIVSIFFDLLFILQHFVLYKNEVVKDSVKQRYEENRVHRVEMNELVQLKLRDLGALELRESMVPLAVPTDYYNRKYNGSSNAQYMESPTYHY